LQTLSQFKAPVIAGGANNPLESAEFGQRLLDKGILYSPDHVANAGGIIDCIIN
jgi:leucine dehydrogenase